MARAHVPGLRSLARMYGVQTAFYDAEGRRREASAEAMLRVLGALGAPVETSADVPGALRERRQELWARSVEPVAVAWDGESAGVELRLPAKPADGTVRCRLALERGEGQSWSREVEELPPADSAVVEGVRYLSRRLSLPDRLPPGYHRLTLEWGGRQFETLVISAPLRAYAPRERAARGHWGVFLPLYALHSRRSWGAGDLTDLESLMGWIGELGGDVVATLPLLPAFLDEPLDPSPYAPVSRLFWNEFYVDVTRAPELERCPSAQALMESPGLQEELEALRSLPLVDYRRQMDLKRRVLQELARCFFEERSERYAAFARFVEANPGVEDYARFRAAIERQRVPWRAWPQPLRDGVLEAGDYDEAARRYHLYAQWLAHEQMDALFRRGRSEGMKLCLDLPLGVHPDGYDVWRERDVFALEVSAGAPPDAFFTKGQDWGFPPLQPERMRKQGYRYLIASLRHHLQHAGILRFDHVMGLHHLYWIPRGMEAHEGVYVRYPAEELYAVLSLESHRQGALIVGEDLGTVPRYVRSGMARHGIHRSYVVQFELAPGRAQPLGAVPAACVASLNTHDMPPFTAFWRGLDIGERLERGLLDDRGARGERKSRQGLKRALLAFLERNGAVAEPGHNGERAALLGCLAYLSASRARAMVVGLEDLWLETRPQNVPGTSEGQPNWRRKARYALEGFQQRPEVTKILRQVDGLRR